MIYAIVFVALATFSITLVFLVTGRQVGETARVVAAISALIAGAGLSYEYRRDLDAALTFLSVFLIIVAICAGTFVFSARQPGNISKAITVVAILGGLSLGFATYRRQTAPDSPAFPDLLRQGSAKAPIYERDGIQFVPYFQPGTRDQPHFATFVLQNCFDAPRQVNLTLTPGSSFAAKRLRLQSRINIEMGAAEVIRLSLPVVSPTYPGTYSLFFDISVSGSGGQRVRLRRAKVPERRITASGTILLLLVGVTAVGGELEFIVGPLPTDIWSQPLLEPKIDILWKPLTKAVLIK